MPQEDVDLPLFDPVVELLHELQFFGISINWNRRKNELNVYPNPSNDLATKIRANFDEMKHLLPGECDFCGHWWIRRFECYWAANPHGCSRCIMVATRLYNKTEQWPEAVWDEDEAFGPPAP